MEIKVVKKVLSVNDAIATEIRRELKERKIFMINVMSSPGSGKTLTLEKTIAKLKKQFKIGVIVGDICTTKDSERLSRTGAPVVQINTEPFGGDCHLGANVIQGALKELGLKKLNFVIIENVGNLVCPAEFEVGEDKKIVVLSLPEGEDKPLKYPLMFRVANAAIVNKIDLAEHLDIDQAQFVKNIKQINPQIPVFELSAKTEKGFDAWVNWLAKQAKAKISASKS
jgi:hydrogenase nickel incorporation protein HypB